VTDADLVLGYLNPAFFLGGKMPLDMDAARRAIQRQIGTHLNLTLMQAAWGIHQLANESMASAARVHAIERSKDVAKFPIFAFGGAGPVHAYGVANILGSPRIIYPFGAGVMSAIGFMTAPLSLDFSRTFPGALDNLDWHAVNNVLNDMETEGKKVLGRIIPADQVSFQRYADMRYRKQGHEIRVPVPDGVLNNSRREELKTNFAQVYLSIYGHTVPDTPIDIVSWRVVAKGPKPQVSLPKAKQDTAPDAEAARKSMRQIYLPKHRNTMKIPVYDRYRLECGSLIQGPAIFEERESTVVVNGPADISVDEYRNLIVDLPQRV
jgi:N-methylhydantoinase A